NAEQVRRGIALATVSLSVQSLLPEFAKRRTSGEKMRTLLEVMIKDATHTG
ncbi:XRE family transcriptional regulator, partial [Salmonella enterica]|nr:XRE family transcriptional regulator [Salmonella enterica]